MQGNKSGDESWKFSITDDGYTHTKAGTTYTGTLNPESPTGETYTGVTYVGGLGTIVADFMSDEDNL